MPYSLLFTYTPDGRVTKVSDYLTANETNYTYDALGNPTSYRGKPLTWEQVAVELHYSWKQTRRIHGRALV